MIYTYIFYVNLCISASTDPILLKKLRFLRYILHLYSSRPRSVGGGRVRRLLYTVYTHERVQLAGLLTLGSNQKNSCWLQLIPTRDDWILIITGPASRTSGRVKSSQDAAADDRKSAARKVGIWAFVWPRSPIALYNNIIHKGVDHNMPVEKTFLGPLNS